MRQHEGVVRPLSQAAKTLGFQIHAFAFIVTMMLLIPINLWTGAPYWMQWVLLGWGPGLLGHWWFVLGPGAPSSGTPDATPQSAANSHERSVERQGLLQ